MGSAKKARGRVRRPATSARKAGAEDGGELSGSARAWVDHICDTVALATDASDAWQDAFDVELTHFFLTRNPDDDDLNAEAAAAWAESIRGKLVERGPKRAGAERAQWVDWSRRGLVQVWLDRFPHYDMPGALQVSPDAPTGPATPWPRKALEFELATGRRSAARRDRRELAEDEHESRARELAKLEADLTKLDRAGRRRDRAGPGPRDGQRRERGREDDRDTRPRGHERHDRQRREGERAREASESESEGDSSRRSGSASSGDSDVRQTQRAGRKAWREAKRVAELHAKDPAVLVRNQLSRGGGGGSFPWGVSARAAPSYLTVVFKHGRRAEEYARGWLAQRGLEKANEADSFLLAAAALDAFVCVDGISMFESAGVELLARRMYATERAIGEFESLEALRKGRKNKELFESIDVVGHDGVVRIPGVDREATKTMSRGAKLKAASRGATS